MVALLAAEHMGSCRKSSYKKYKTRCLKLGAHLNQSPFTEDAHLIRCYVSQMCGKEGSIKNRQVFSLPKSDFYIGRDYFFE